MIDKSFVDSILRYEPETGLFFWKVSPAIVVRAGSPAGTTDRKGYIGICIKRKKYKAHRLAWLVTHGMWPQEQIDHINGVKSDNRIVNLRQCDSFGNAQNQKSKRGRIKGISYIARLCKWQAEIRSRGVREYLGIYSTPEEAHAAYWNAAQSRHGPFAKSG